MTDRKLTRTKGKLILGDGSSFSGYSFGSLTDISGEVVFNTGMVGYPEALTDPSYRGQILTLTYPLIGNYGVPPHSHPQDQPGQFYDNFESEEIQVRGLICSEYSFQHNHWHAQQSLAAWLQEEEVPALFGIDTRRLTKKLREKGTMLAQVEIGQEQEQQQQGLPLIRGELFDPDQQHMVRRVSCQQLRRYSATADQSQLNDVTVLGLDCGVKHSIIRSFLRHGVDYIRAPHDYNPFASASEQETSEETDLEFDALFISNGPGDPTYNQQAIQTVREALNRDIPTFGICLGHQLLALAVGAQTYKLKYGHRAQNQPVRDLETGQCYITSQNHGFCVREDSLPENWQIWFKNVNDGTVEGIKHKDKPFYGLQFHPEAQPGPTDTQFLFERFLQQVKDHQTRN